MIAAIREVPSRFLLVPVILFTILSVIDVIEVTERRSAR
jgi:hypothetical protein